MSLQASVFFLTFASVSYHTAIMYHHQSVRRISAIRIEPVPCYARLDNLLGGAENARLENAELENAAPNCRTGKRETGKHENGLVMESRSSLNSR